MIPRLLRVPSRRFAAGQQLDFLARRLALPPRVIPPLRVPKQLLPSCKPALRRMVSSSLDIMRCLPAKEWVLGNVKLIKGPLRRWSNYANGARACAECDPALVQTSSLGNQPPWRHPSCGGAQTTTTAGDVVPGASTASSSVPSKIIASSPTCVGTSSTSLAPYKNNGANELAG